MEGGGGGYPGQDGLAAAGPLPLPLSSRPTAGKTEARRAQGIAGEAGGGRGVGTSERFSAGTRPVVGMVGGALTPVCFSSAGAPQLSLELFVADGGPCQHPNSPIRQRQDILILPR